MRTGGASDAALTECRAGTDVPRGEFTAFDEEYFHSQKQDAHKYYSDGENYGYHYSFCSFAVQI